MPAGMTGEATPTLYDFNSTTSNAIMTAPATQPITTAAITPPLRPLDCLLACATARSGAMRQGVRQPSAPDTHQWQRGVSSRRVVRRRWNVAAGAAGDCRRLLRGQGRVRVGQGKNGWRAALAVPLESCSAVVTRLSRVERIAQARVRADQALAIAAALLGGSRGGQRNEGNRTSVTAAAGCGHARKPSKPPPFAPAWRHRRLTIQATGSSRCCKGSQPRTSQQSRRSAWTASRLRRKSHHRRRAALRLRRP